MSACADVMKKTFCRLNLIKPCLKIVFNLLHGGKDVVDKVEQIPGSNNEHSIYCDCCHISHAFIIG